MSIDAKKHTSWAAGELPTRASLASAIFSIDDIIPVANATEANQVAAAVASAGQVLASNPVFVSRADARGLHRIEYSYDGTVWLPASGMLSFASKSAADTWASSNSALLTVDDVASAGGIRYRWSGTAWVTLDIYATLTRAAAQALVAATAADVSFSAVSAQRGFTVGALPVTTLAIPTAGDYEISASAVVSQVGSNYANMVLFVNGVAVVSETGSVFPHTNAYSRCVISPAIRTIGAGQLVKLQVTASSNGNIEANSAFLSVKRVD